MFKLLEYGRSKATLENMLFIETPLPGAFTIDIEPFQDDRGLFARTFCTHEFEAHGLATKFVQSNLSVNANCGTLRGMHYQSEPQAEAKLIRCTQGRLFDVIVDLRPNSSTYRQWVGVELTSENRRALYVPEGFAHGFITLTDNTEAHYLVSQFYTPESETGVRWDDPAIGIEWPSSPTAISEKDASWPNLV